MKIGKILFMVILFSFSICNAQMCGRIKQVSCGEFNTLALMEDKSLMVCGGNHDCYYQLGLGSNKYQITYLQQVLDLNGVGYLKNIICFDAGWTHSLAADSNGTLFSWGHDTNGQLGNGSSGDSNVPIRVSNIDGSGYLSDTRRIVEVSAGRSGKHSLVVDSNGYVYAFGYNCYGQCGDGNSIDRQLPVRVLDADPNTTNAYLSHITAVSAGVDHSLALDANSHVWEWGTNNNNSRIPKIVKLSNGSILGNIRAISSRSYSLALDSNGCVWEWETGFPAKVKGGQMGTTNLEHIVAIAAGNSSVAIDSNGNVWKWGSVGGSPTHIVAGEMETLSGYLENICQIDVGYYDFIVAVDKYGYGWSWGSSNRYGELGVGDTTERTDPTKMLCPEVSEQAYLTKTYIIEGIEPNCAKPFLGYGIDDNYLTFTISYGNPTTNPTDPNYMGILYDVNITDVLPYEVDFYSATNGAQYDANSHCVTLHLNTFSPGEEDYFEIKTKINNHAFPLTEIHNYSELDTNNYYAISEVNIPICNWGGEIIYVDKDANNVYHNGTSWDYAFTTIQQGLAEANRLGSNITAVWIAAGTYKPVYDMNSGYQSKSFGLMNNLALIGHFGGVGTYETSPDQRVLNDANNTTTLDGRIGTTQSHAVQRIIYAKDVSNVLLDGFTIKNAYGSGTSGNGLYTDNSDISVVNCRFENNYQYGIYAYQYSYPDIHNCVFFNNAAFGIYSNYHCQPVVSYSVFDGNNINGTQGLQINSLCAAVVENCVFKNNKNYGIYGTGNGSLNVSGSHFTNNQYGIRVDDITTDITDCNIANSTQYGVYLLSDSDFTAGNSIIKNNSYDGIYSNDSDFSISRCLISGNSQNGIYATGGCNTEITNSVIRRNGYNGLRFKDCPTISVKNCWINKNGIAHLTSNGCSGIYLENASQTPVIRNNTIYDNWTYGIQMNQYGPDPNVRNCIVYGNDVNDFFRTTGGDAFDAVRFSCLQHSRNGTGNFVADPMFMNSTDPNNLHIDSDSPCVDAGDPCGIYANETDIDGEIRNNGRVDCGADEDFWSYADYDLNGIVNFLDYRYLTQDWMASQSNYSLDDDNDIDMYDLAIVCRDWLWQNQTNWLDTLEGMSLQNVETESLQMESLSLSRSSVSIESISEISVASETESVNSSSDSLMITDLGTSKALMPKKLAKKVNSFYAITPQSVAKWKARTSNMRSIQSGLAVSGTEACRVGFSPRGSEPVDVNSILNWLDDVWANDAVVRESMTESEYLEFRESIRDLDN